MTRDFSIRPIFPLTTLCLLVLVVSSGCSKEKMKSAYQEAKNKATEYTEEYTEAAVATVKEQLPEYGNIELRSNDPIEKTDSASIEIIDIGDGRPLCVQIASYDISQEQRTYPAIYFHGQTTAKAISELASTTISCDMYVQTVVGGRIAMTPDGQSARLKFGDYDSENSTIKATLSRTKLILSNDAPFIINGGDIIAKVKEQQP